MFTLHPAGALVLLAAMATSAHADISRSLKTWDGQAALSALSESEATGPSAVQARATAWVYLGRYEQAKLAVEDKESLLYRVAEAGTNAQAGWKTWSYQGFEISAPSRLEEADVRPVAEVAREQRQAITKLFGVTEAWTIRIELTANRDQLAKLSGRPNEFISSGAAGFCNHGRIALVWRGTPDQDFQTLLAHELAHYVMVRLGLGDAPLWVQEGVAEFAHRGGANSLAEMLAGNTYAEARAAFLAGRASVEEVERGLREVANHGRSTAYALALARVWAWRKVDGPNFLAMDIVLAMAGSEAPWTEERESQVQSVLATQFAEREDSVVDTLLRRAGYDPVTGTRR